MKPYSLKNKNKIILIQPTMGLSSEFVCHIPLSLLYVASSLVKNGFEVVILDNRLNPHKWKNVLLQHLDSTTLLVGLTVMSGSPIANAIEVSKFIKNIDNIPIVWGGAHPTIMPKQILENNFVDFTVSGSGVNSVVQLAETLKNFNSADNALDGIAGLGYKRKSNIHINTPFKGFEHVVYKDIPYFLIKDFTCYSQIGSSETVFPIYSAYGCPYKCSFCVSPSLYHDFKCKWLTLSPKEVVDHIEYLKHRYGATEVYFYDDDSFVKLEHIKLIIEEVRRRKLQIKMSFRGVRVDEILRMDEDYLNNLAEAGTHILHIGIESGSQRILDLFKKGFKVEDIILMNRFLAKNKKIIAAYNWIVGTPSETIEDIEMSRKLILQLVEENPRCFIFQPNKFRPLPGTELAELAIKYGYRYPSRLEEWIYDEVEGDMSQPWYTDATESMIRMLQVTAYFIDNKPNLLLEDKKFSRGIIKLAYKTYRPLAKLRFKHGFTAGLLEYPVFQYFVSKYRR